MPTIHRLKDTNSVDAHTDLVYFRDEDSPALLPLFEKTRINDKALAIAQRFAIDTIVNHVRRGQIA